MGRSKQGTPATSRTPRDLDRHAGDRTAENIRAELARARAILAELTRYLDGRR